MNLNEIINTDAKPAPDDYFGSDGLLFCGKCHTPKQTRGGEGWLSGQILPISCECNRKEREHSEEQKKREQIEYLREKCFPAEAMRKHTFDVANNVEHLQKARGLVDNWSVASKEDGFLFWGNTGSGKSFTAHCIANALIDKGIPVRHYTVAEIARSMGREIDNIISVARTMPLLIIDDIGTERDTSYGREQVFSVLNERIESNKPLIVTTNYSLDDIYRSTGDNYLARVFDRLSLLTPVCITGASWRREIGRRNIQKTKEILGL